MNKFPDKENRFDWNKIQDITYEEFIQVLSQVSKTQKKKRVHAEGIKGLEKGKDYEIVYQRYYRIYAFYS